MWTLLSSNSGCHKVGHKPHCVIASNWFLRLLKAPNYFKSTVYNCVSYHTAQNISWRSSCHLSCSLYFCEVSRLQSNFLLEIKQIIITSLAMFHCNPRYICLLFRFISFPFIQLNTVIMGWAQSAKKQVTCNIVPEHILCGETFGPFPNTVLLSVCVCVCCCHQPQTIWAFLLTSHSCNLQR